MKILGYFSLDSDLLKFDYKMTRQELYYEGNNQPPKCLLLIYIIFVSLVPSLIINSKQS